MNQMIRSIGLDVHPTTVYVTILSPSEDRLDHYEFPMEPHALEAFLASLQPGDRVALEATGTTYYLYRRLKEVVDDVVVANPNKLRKLPQDRPERLRWIGLSGLYRGSSHRVDAGRENPAKP